MKNSNFVKKTIRGVTISLCIFAGLTSTTNGIPRDDDKYVLMKQIDTNPKYLLNQVKISRRRKKLFL